MDETYDVVVIGGGAAGLSSAVALGRSRRSVLVVDSGEPRNAPAAHVHNFLTRDGTLPQEILAIGREEVRRYGGHFQPGQVTAVRRDGDRFLIELGAQLTRARRVIVATGLHDTLPDVPGLAERWGIDVLHCPYCHGWEVRDQRIGILATSPLAGHAALLFGQLSAQVTVLTHTGPRLADAQRAQFHALGMEIVDGVVERVDTDAGRLSAVGLDDGSTVDLDALVVSPRFAARAGFLEPLGLRPVEVRMGEQVIGTQLEADPTGATGVVGVWAAGNVADMRAQVVSSAASGLMVGAAVNLDLITADAAIALATHLDTRVYGEQAWDDRYRDRTRLWSARPNPVLVAEAADLSAGTALDAGCGEGADACWLAARGWQVTGVDLSGVALERAAAHADELGLAVQWRQLDLSRAPAPDSYDLVTAHFLHLPRAVRETVFGNLADAVAPGGTLLVVGHDPTDAAVLPRPHLAEMGWTANEVAESLGPDWTILVAEARPRTVTHPDGHEVTIHDAVLRARRGHWS